jgi:hypothetical protein
MWSKEFISNDQKQSIIFKALNITAQKHESNYIKWIHAKFIFKLWWTLKLFDKRCYEKSL